MDIQFVVIVKVSKSFALVTQGCKTIVSARQYVMFHTEFSQPTNQLIS